MNRIKTIYETPDGRTFNTIAEAEAYLNVTELEEKLRQWLLDHETVMTAYDRNTILAVAQTIAQNATEFRSLLPSPLVAYTLAFPKTKLPEHTGYIPEQSGEQPEQKWLDEAPRDGTTDTTEPSWTTDTTNTLEPRREK